MDKKVVIVTGSSIGLGNAIIKKYASNNYNVVITYLSHEKEAYELKEEVTNKYNVDALVVKCDISKEEDIDNLKTQVLKKFNKVDVLVNNAGIAIDTTFEDKVKKNFMKTLEVNLVGTFLMSKVFGEIMDNGNIINISSTNGIDTYYEYSIDYDASKAGIINLSHNLANHFNGKVRVNTVCPGWIDTPMNKELDSEYKHEEEEKIILNRFAEPKEIANVVYFLSSEDASYVNDSVIRVDGGKRC